jgi:glutathione S-transferase
MTGGIVVVIGETGRNFAAGMSGGIAYVLDEDGSFANRCNLSMVDLEPVEEEEMMMQRLHHHGGDLEGHGLVDVMADMDRFDGERLHQLVAKHAAFTGSARAQLILDNWEKYLPKFRKVMPVEYRKGESRTEAFLRMNPMGQVPVIELDDGRSLAQSNAIIRYLAVGSALLPSDTYEQAKVDELMCWEQYNHEPYVAVCRFHMVYLGRPKEAREKLRVERAEAALDLMQKLLADRSFLVGGGLTVADISLLAYTRLAHEGGFDLEGRPALRAWIARCEAALGIAAARPVAA